MKRSKREENAIVVYFILYSVLFVALVLLFFIKTLPEIRLVEKSKVNTQELYNNIVRIEKSWLELEEFKSLTDKKNRVVIEILSNMSDTFYSDKLWNNTSDSYKTFLDNIKKDLNSAENKAIMDKKRSEIANMLPTYYEDSLDLWEDVLSDYKFINYLELLIESFNFESNSSIGISRVTLLEDFSVNKTAWNPLESNIFFIPLNLVLKWTKSSIIDFLFFIENVWNIEVLEDEILLSGNNSFLSKNWVPKIIEGDKFTYDYNIFEHQITDIQKISMSNYIDTSYIIRWEKDFKDFIIDTQWDEEFEINIDLMFYVKWQPIYVIEESILSILDKQVKTKWAILAKMKTISQWSINYIQLEKDLKTLSTYDKEISSIKKELIKKEHIEKIYSRVLRIDSVIDPISKSLNK